MKEREELLEKIMDLISETDLCFYDLLGMLEGIKMNLLIEHMGSSLPEVLALWKQQQEEKNDK